MIESRQSKHMGERKCAFEGCNALEFRTSGYCLRHRGGMPKVENESSKSEYTVYANSGDRRPGQSDADWWVLEEEESEIQPEESNEKKMFPDSSENKEFLDYFFIFLGLMATLYILHHILTWEMCIAIGHNTC